MGIPFQLGSFIEIPGVPVDRSSFRSVRYNSGPNPSSGARNNGHRVGAQTLMQDLFAGKSVSVLLYELARF